ncbi:helix-turn-helix transcriptional regulator [Alkalimonas collagenimarina]|uniref:Helix-turn-helix transcriptional regulator n=1 Tax=Alkalimonas collagenimarina TaxID=400390 RepID=A0ABT9GWZ1_9GAMM|nr:helix-turn-helix transcriptional regulator [Alkalimonas collagenimarina]MDP4535577.1 helix-turn-helix transcriptional regulator [Alkalimonas collagenimarina]
MSSQLGIKINRLRKEKGFTLESLAKAANVSKSYLWELENREVKNPSAQRLAIIAAQLGVTADYFLDDDTSQPEEKHLDDAFFRNYKNLGAQEKDQLRKILETFKKS